MAEESKYGLVSIKKFDMLAAELGAQLLTDEEAIKGYLLLEQPVTREAIEPFFEEVGIKGAVKWELLEDEDLIRQTIDKQKPIKIIDTFENTIPLYDVLFKQYDDAIWTFRQELYEEEEHGSKKKAKLPILNIEKETLVAVRLPPDDFQNQLRIYDIFGELIERTRDGVFYKLGEGVVEKENGEIYSTTAGYLAIHNKTLSVIDTLRINSLADLSGDSLDFIGSIEIGQNVILNFDVTAGGDILVQGSTEGANLKAKKRVICKEGLIGENAKVEAVDKIKAKYVNQTEIFCEQDCEIDKGLFHAIANCHGRLWCKQGPIVGGATYASYGLVARTLGASSGVRTLIYAGFSNKVQLSLDILESESKRLKLELIELVKQTKPLLEAQQKGANLTPSMKQEMAKLLTRAKKFRQMITEIEEWLETHDMEACENAHVDVIGEVHPGVLIFLHNYRFEVKEKMNRVSFAYDGKEDCIKPRTLKYIP